MTRSWLIRVIILTLLLSLTIPMLACEEQGGEQETNESDAVSEPIGETEDSNDDGSGAGGESNITEEPVTGETESSSSDVTTDAPAETDPPYEDVVYKNGSILKGAGASFAKNAFATTAHSFDATAAIEKSASEILALLKNKTGAKAGEVYKVTEPIALQANTTYYGNGAAIIAEGGISISGADKVTIKDIIINGSITISNSENITLYRVDIQSSGTAITADKKSTDIEIEDCRISAKEAAVVTDASAVSVYLTYAESDNGIISTGDYLTVQGSQFEVKSLGISANGDSSVIRNNRITASKSGTGIEFKKGSYNSIAALNIIRDVQLSVSVNEGYNCVVILNSAIKVEGRDCKNLYVIKNSLGGYISLENNNYLICDGNTHTDDSLPHGTVNKNNGNFNGDNLHDVDARLEVGADENLLPHTNKDLFIGMERKSVVTDLSTSQNYALNKYIENEAKSSSTVIVPPGAYSVSAMCTLSGSQDNTDIYAYGVYMEAKDYIKLIDIKDTNNISINGLTVGYSGQSAGQMQVLKKLSNNQLLVISSAGFGKDFGATDPSRFVSGGSGCYLFHSGEFTSWTELGAWGNYKIVPNENGSTFNSDGTFTIQLTGTQAGKYFTLIKTGEILACRLNEGNDRTMTTSNASNILFKDTVLYGYSDAMTLISSGTSTGVQLYRHHNLAHSAPMIDKETYNKYKALEQTYGVNLDVYIDEENRYRGSTPRIGSMDASHSVAASEGISATSTLFENACDDASNQRGESSCLHRIIDNKDGTSTIIYKANISQTYYDIARNNGATQSSGTYTRDFEAGDTIFIYACNGNVLCNTTVLSASQVYKTNYVMLDEDYTVAGQTLHWKWTCTLYSVKVNTADLNMAAVKGLDYEQNGPDTENKVLVDNISRSSEGFTFDNVMVRHNRGRVMIKTRNATVKNSTFTKNSYAGIVLSPELTWGEATAAQNIVISKCLFDSISQTFNMHTNTKFAAIAIEGLGATNAEINVSENSLPAQNILIEGNTFRNIPNNYFITVSAAKGVTIKNNTFETGSVASQTVKVNTRAILIRGCMDIDISGNTFPASVSDITKVIVANNYSDLHGSNVEGIFAKDKLE